MNTQWINCQNNNQLIIFFNGWGMSDSVLLEMDHSGFDVLMVNDYRSLGLEMPDISGYEKKYLIAWSMGVWASGVCSIDVDKSIAINGTPAPVNNQSGIDPVILSGTHKNWNEASRKKFNRRMAGSTHLFENQKHLFSIMPVELQKTELQCIEWHALHSDMDRKWSLAIIGTDDAVFTPQNQQKYWDGKAEICRIKMPHWPFDHFKNWNTILSL